MICGLWRELNLSESQRMRAKRLRWKKTDAGSMVENVINSINNFHRVKKCDLY